jgi:hypothetical protein
MKLAEHKDASTITVNIRLRNHPHRTIPEPQNSVRCNPRHQQQQQQQHSSSSSKRTPATYIILPRQRGRDSPGQHVTV